jgi:hypothetical protein
LALVRTDHIFDTLTNQRTLQPTSEVTRFAHVGRGGAIAILAGLLALMGICISLALRQPLARPSLHRQKGDLALYQGIIGRVHHGERYYAASAAELRATGEYGMQSVFNWRTPLLIWGLAQLPDPIAARWILGLLALIAIVLIRQAARADGGMAMGLAAPVMAFFGGLIGAFSPDGLYFGEMWAGVLICLSMASLGMGWCKSGVLAGLFALFIRELAMPYVLVAAGLALWRKRWRQLALWVAGLAAYAIYYALHAREVSKWVLPTDPADPSGWLQFGGLKYLLVITRWRGLSVTPPDWVMGIYLPIGLLGRAAWKGDVGRRAGLAVAVYLIVFACVGKPYNDYWGMVFDPLLAIGLAWGCLALWDLLRAIFRPAIP